MKITGPDPTDTATSGRNPFGCWHVVPGVPVPKPRMTRRDKWQKRDCVLRYRAWADRVRLTVTGNPQGRLSSDIRGVSVKAFMPIPGSLSVKRRLALENTWHDKKPDADNILKSVLDALFDEDGHISQATVEKRWSQSPRIEIALHTEPS